MSRTMQSITLGLALATAGFAGAAFVHQAQAERAMAPNDHGIAFVDVFGLVDQLVMQPEPTAKRVSFEGEGQTKMQQMQMQLQGLVQQMQSADPSDPAAQAAAQGAQQQAQQLQQQLQQTYQQYQYDMQALIAGQIADAYKRVYGVAQTVAAERGIPFVFATRPNSELLQIDSITGVAQEILARPLVAPPESTDLTKAVREELGLPEPTKDNTGLNIEGGVVTPGASAPGADQPGEKKDEPAQPAGNGG